MAETKLMCLTHGESGSSHPEMFGECWFKTYTRLIPKAYPEWERVENGECRMVERVLSVPGELVDPGDWSIVRHLAKAQIAKLEKHRHDRGEDGWLNMEPRWLLERLLQEVQELTANPSWEEAADVANFAAFFVDA